MLRATTIAKNTATWLPRVPAYSSKPNIALALLGHKYFTYARAVFSGGYVPWRNGESVKAVSRLKAEIEWESAQAAGNLVENLCDVKDQSTGIAKCFFQNADSRRSSSIAMRQIWRNPSISQVSS